MERTLVLTGDNITLYRFITLKQMMQMELKGIYSKINPFDVAVREFGFKAEYDDEDRILNKDEIYRQTVELSNEDAIRMMSKEHSTKEDEDEEEDEAEVATGKCDKVFELLGGFFEITQKQIIHLLVSAFEGGSNYWYWIVKYNKPSSPEMIPADYAEFHHVSYCWGDGSITICDKEDYFENDRSVKGLTTWKLTEERIVIGLELFARNHKKMFLAWAEHDDYDANTADVFLQYCLFGELVYG